MLYAEHVSNDDRKAVLLLYSDIFFVFAVRLLSFYLLLFRGDLMVSYSSSFPPFLSFRRDKSCDYPSYPSPLHLRATILQQVRRAAEPGRGSLSSFLRKQESRMGSGERSPLPYPLKAGGGRYTSPGWASVAEMRILPVSGAVRGH